MPSEPLWIKVLREFGIVLYGILPALASQLPVLGRTYRYRYGYPWRWAFLAEVAWRIEHLPWRYDGFARWGYRRRKACERRGAA